MINISKDSIIDFEGIKACINKGGYKIINLVRSNKYKIFVIGTAKENFIFIEKEIVVEILDEIFNELKKIKGLAFVIFNEYFFSYHAIIPNDIFDIIINKCKEITNNLPNIILLINLLHIIENKKVPSEYKNKMENYLNIIKSDPITEPDSIIWNVSSNTFKEIFIDQNKNYISNESFVIMRNEILFTYKKSTYYKELQSNYDYNYYIGFGKYEEPSRLSNELKNIAEFLMKNISIDICADIQNEVKYINFDNYYIIQYKPELSELEKIRKGVVSYTNKKLIIIQSNYTNIYSAIYQFPEGIIISKSDPIQEIVCKIKKKDEICEINRLKLYLQKEIESFVSKYKITNEAIKKLNKFYESKKNLIDNYNSHKLISEYNKKISFEKIVNDYQLIFNIYDINS